MSRREQEPDQKPSSPSSWRDLLRAKANAGMEALNRSRDATVAAYDDFQKKRAENTKEKDEARAAKEAKAKAAAEAKMHKAKEDAPHLLALANAIKESTPTKKAKQAEKALGIEARPAFQAADELDTTAAGFIATLNDKGLNLDKASLIKLQANLAGDIAHKEKSQPSADLSNLKNLEYLVNTILSALDAKAIASTTRIAANNIRDNVGKRSDVAAQISVGLQDPQNDFPENCDALRGAIEASNKASETAEQLTTAMNEIIDPKNEATLTIQLQDGIPIQFFRAEIFEPRSVFLVKLHAFIRAAKLAPEATLHELDEKLKPNSRDPIAQKIQDQDQAFIKAIETQHPKYIPVIKVFDFLTSLIASAGELYALHKDMVTQQTNNGKVTILFEDVEAKINKAKENAGKLIDAIDKLKTANPTVIATALDFVPVFKMLDKAEAGLFALVRDYAAEHADTRKAKEAREEAERKETERAELIVKITAKINTSLNSAEEKLDATPEYSIKNINALQTHYQEIKSNLTEVKTVLNEYTNTFKTDDKQAGKYAALSKQLVTLNEEIKDLTAQKEAQLKAEQNKILQTQHEEKATPTRATPRYGESGTPHQQNDKPKTPSTLTTARYGESGTPHQQNDKPKTPPTLTTARYGESGTHTKDNNSSELSRIRNQFLFANDKYHTGKYKSGFFKRWFVKKSSNRKDMAHLIDEILSTDDLKKVTGALWLVSLDIGGRKNLCSSTLMRICNDILKDSGTKANTIDPSDALKALNTHISKHQCLFSNKQYRRWDITKALDKQLEDLPKTGLAS